MDIENIDKENSPFLDCDDIEDTRSELRFDKDQETDEEKTKRIKIENALNDPNSDLKTWQNLALTEFGLVGDDLRRKIWPLLLEIDPNPIENTPKLKDLEGHKEYHQVIVDVNRSLRRFPPGIPYKQRLALQDQLTVLILRVIIKYPHLHYYQGYHDVAVTFLLVVGEAVAFRIMERLSTDHLSECMEPTMEKTGFRLQFIYALLARINRKLCDYMDEAEVGTMFALPWYITWFGHSLNYYKDVVRLYDFFLATPPLMPLYVAACLINERQEEIFKESCDMASIHCLLNPIPDDFNFEKILPKALVYYKKNPPEQLGKDVNRRMNKEHLKRNRTQVKTKQKCIYGILFAAAAVIVGYYAYSFKVDNIKFGLFSFSTT